MPLRLTDPDVLRTFSIWTGPGVRINGQPKGLQRYKVSFFCKFPREEVARLAYVVLYERDPETKRGYIYLPGRGDEHYGLNTSSIVHSVEGHWFYASDAWERLVGSLVETATTTHLPT